jgi:hypothetical protein
LCSAEHSQPAVLAGDGEDEDMNYALGDDPEAMVAAEARDAAAALGECFVRETPAGQIRTNCCAWDLPELQARWKASELRFTVHNEHVEEEKAGDEERGKKGRNKVRKVRMG